MHERLADGIESAHRAVLVAEGGADHEKGRRPPDRGHVVTRGAARGVERGAETSIGPLDPEEVTTTLAKLSKLLRCQPGEGPAGAWPGALSFDGGARSPKARP
jgi:hypothetical protein